MAVKQIVSTFLFAFVSVGAFACAEKDESSTSHGEADLSILPAMPASKPAVEAQLTLTNRGVDTVGVFYQGRIGFWDTEKNLLSDMKGGTGFQSLGIPLFDTLPPDATQPLTSQVKGGLNWGWQNAPADCNPTTETSHSRTVYVVPWVNNQWDKTKKVESQIDLCQKKLAINEKNQIVEDPFQ